MTIIDKIATTVDTLWFIFLLMQTWVLHVMYDGNYEIWLEETLRDTRGRIFIYLFKLSHYGMLITVIYWPVSFIWRKL
jgi:hypothetical protein